VHQLEFSNLLSTPSAIELCLKIFRSNTYFAKPNICHTKLNIISKPCISVFVHFKQSLQWWVHQEKVCNTSFKSKHNQDMSKDFELFENLNVQTPTIYPPSKNSKKKNTIEWAIWYVLVQLHPKPTIFLDSPIRFLGYSFLILFVINLNLW
jgi:hypothetical protein